MSGAIFKSIFKSMTLAALAAAGAWAQVTTNCTPASLPEVIGVVVSVTCQPAGGVAPYTWSSTGTLPPNLTQDPSTGAITGTLVDPPGPYVFTVVATDSTVGTHLTGSQLYSGKTVDPLGVICTLANGPLEVGVPYQNPCTASGGTPPYTWSVSGQTVPPGLTISSAGLVTDTPTSALASYQYRVLATDSSPTILTKSVSFTGAIAPAVAITTTSPLPPGAVGSVYPQQQFAAGGGVTPYGWSAPLLAGTGLTMSATGLLAGTPLTAGPINFTAIVTDAAGGTGSAPFTLTVNAALTITTKSPLPAATVEVSYTQAFAATGGSGSGYTWSVTGQPGWLTMSTSGSLAGSPPLTAITSTFTVQVMDSGGNTTSGQFTLPVSVAITTSSPLPAASIPNTYNQTLTAIGGTGVYTWTETGALPAGLGLNSSGLITGQPTANAVTSTFSAKVTDSASASATASLTLPVTLVIETVSPLPAATAGAAYSQTFAAGGGAGGYTWSATLLPSWLSMSAAGVLTSASVPTTAVTATFTVQATDSAKNTVSGSFTVPVALTITTPTTLPPAVVNTLYKETFTAAGGAGGYTWTSTALPTWATLTTAGVLTGTPTATGPVSFPITVTDSASGTQTATFTLAVNTSALTITTSSPLASGAVGAAYNQTLTGTGGTPPYSWSLAAGSALLPAGLKLGATTGAISGVPTAAGTFPFTIELTDSATPANTTTKPFVIVIAGGLTITTAAALPNATVGVAYAQTLTATGGTAPYTWAVTAGALPTPLALNPATGQITGTPTAIATAAAFTVTVNDSAGSPPASKAFTLAVVAAPVVTTATLPNGAPGVFYSQTLLASGGTTPYSWTISAGSLPAVLSLSTAGAISGIPNASGTSTFTVKLTDATGVTASKQLTLTIATALTISTASPLPTGEAGISYSVTLAAAGGAPPYTWSVTGGGLPPGLSLSTSGGISGVPGTAGTFNFTAQAADSNHATASAAFALTIVAPVTISTAATLDEGSVGSAYSESLAASGGVTPYVWSLTSGTLPPGLNLSAGGAITGTPTITGTSQFTVKVTDGLGATSSRQFIIVVAIGLTISTPPTLPGATVNVIYSELLLASGGTAPYSWVIPSGLPPTGVSLRSDGNLTGLPSAAGVFSFMVQVTDSLGHKASELVSLTVAPALSITTSALAGGAVGAAYAQSLAGTGGTPPYSWSLQSGTLPAGLALSAAGSIAGTPSAAGTVSFTIKLTDSALATATKQLSITIVGGLSITTGAALPNATAGVSYAQTLEAAGGAPPYTWTGTPPAGFTLSAAGALAGTPATGGTFTFTATVTDSAGATASRLFTLIVSGGLAITSTTLPGGTTGTAYSQTLTASGGTPPYAFSKSAGALPPGITLSGATLSGTPTTAGSYTFTVEVTDSASATATQQFTIAITSGITGLSITTTALPAAAVGVPYSETVSASGGSGYAWAVTQGALPAGLSLDASGAITGTPTTAGTLNVTIQVTDSAKATASASFALAVAGFAGLPATASPGQQLSFSLELGTPPAQGGQVTLTFQPEASLTAPADDPSIQFSTGGRTVTIPDNATGPIALAIQTGTVAGSITLTVSWEGEPAPAAQTIQVATVAPGISGVTATTTSSGFQVVVSGYSNPRDLSQAVLQFTAAPGQTLQTSTFTVSLTSASTAWFGGSASDQYGGEFVVTLPFTVSNGSASAIGSVAVQLVNGAGTSTSADATF